MFEDSKKQNRNRRGQLMHGLIISLLKALLDSIRSQVKAAEIANEGITLEYESGR